MDQNDERDFAEEQANGALLHDYSEVTVEPTTLAESARIKSERRNAFSAAVRQAMTDERVTRSEGAPHAAAATPGGVYDRDEADRLRRVDIFERHFPLNPGIPQGRIRYPDGNLSWFQRNTDGTITIGMPYASETVTPVVFDALVQHKGWEIVQDDAR